MTQAKRLMPTGQCWCGCGEATARRSLFTQGHDRKAESRLIKMIYGEVDSVALFLDAYGYGPDGKNLDQAYEAWERDNRSG